MGAAGSVTRAAPPVAFLGAGTLGAGAAGTVGVDPGPGSDAGPGADRALGAGKIGKRLR